MGGGGSWDGGTSMAFLSVVVEDMNCDQGDGGVVTLIARVLLFLNVLAPSPSRTCGRPAKSHAPAPPQLRAFHSGLCM
jgi:hypothetical protein